MCTQGFTYKTYADCGHEDESSRQIQRGDCQTNTCTNSSAHSSLGIHNCGTKGCMNIFINEQGRVRGTTSGSCPSCIRRAAM